MAATFEIIDDFSSLAALRDAWNALVLEMPRPNVFLSHEWMTAWWEFFGSDRRLRVVVAREDDRLLGLAPLAIQTRTLGVPVPRTLFLGDGISDHLDLILPASACCELAADILRFITGSSMSSARQPLKTGTMDETGNAALESAAPNLGGGTLQSRLEARFSTARVSMLDFGRVPEHSSLYRWVCEHDLDANSESLTGGRWEVHFDEVSPILDLPSTWEEYWKGLSRNTKESVRRRRNQLARFPGYRLARIEDEDELPFALDAFFRLHQQRWQRRWLPGVFFSKRVQQFHREVAVRFLRKGWLNLYLLSVEEKPVGVLYAFVFGQRIWYYGAGFDPAWGRFSPGTVVMAQCIQDAITRGCTSFEFLRGGEPYKYRWGARPQNTYRLRWIAGNPSSRVLHRLLRAQDAVFELGKRLLSHL